jgi:hypothetical protein
MKSLLLGILLIVLIGIGGFVYRNAVEHPAQPITCPLDSELCPDGTSVSRTGFSCTFPACPPPNTSLSNVGISFAVPPGFMGVALPDADSVAAYESPASTASKSASDIIIRRFAIDSSSTALGTIQQTAIGGTSGAPVSATSFSSTALGNRRYTVVLIDRFEGIIDTAYYLARNLDVLRFDAIDRDVMNWTDPNLDLAALPAHVALVKLLTTLQGQ